MSKVSHGPGAKLPELSLSNSLNVSFRFMFNYHAPTDQYIARLDVLCNCEEPKDTALPTKGDQFNAMFEIKTSSMLLKPHNIDPCMIGSANADDLIEIFEGMAAAIREATRKK